MDCLGPTTQAIPWSPPSSLLCSAKEDWEAEEWHWVGHLASPYRYFYSLCQLEICMMSVDTEDIDLWHDGVS
jgi:hypothetical protein